MATPARSLMDFIDTPVLVGDPDGRAVYVNPSFERYFETSKESVTGVPLASLFDGGARESVLRAVAGVCSGAPSARVRLREGGRGWVALASPVEADEGRVGVVILLTEEEMGEDRLLAFRREIIEPLEELSQCLADFSEQTGGRRGEKYRVLIADGVRALERIRKFAGDVETKLLGGRG
jgi:PAS domain-containing protein